MYRNMVLLLVMLNMAVFSQSTFEKECVSCHTKTDVSLQKVFMDTLLVYGGKENMKAGLEYYFRNPRVDNSVMDEDFLQKNGLKESMALPSDVMREALEQYWQIYTVIGKLQ